jgi:hypothetical protein
VRAPRGIVELPFGKGRKFVNDLPRWADTIVGGWQMAYIFQRQSGAPIGFGNIIFTGDIKTLRCPKTNQAVICLSRRCWSLSATAW